jgi:caspase domain-containing protein
MLNRRSFLRGLSAGVPVLALPGAARAQAKRPRLHAMVVGINTYYGRAARGQVPNLLGCINDANDIAQQVAKLDPGSLRVLGTRNEPVTRSAFLTAWQDMVVAAGEGDTLLLTYSGHGGQIRQLCPGNEEDGYDETLILSGFDIGQAREAAEHIVDDELAERFAAAAAKRLLVVFVADSCFSGTVYRSVETAANVRYRTIRSYELTRGASSANACSAAAPEDPPNLLFLSGSQENEVVPEINVDGQWRGALSYAVARALEGRAARGGVVTAYGLSEFVLRYVQSLSDAGQHPSVTWPSRTRTTPNDVMTVERSTPVVMLDAMTPPPAPRSAHQDEVWPVRLRFLGLIPAERLQIANSLTHAILVTESDPAALIWDARQQLILNDQGHRIAEDVDAGALQHAIDRRRAWERVSALSAENGLTVRIRLRGEPPGARASAASDATHKEGTRLFIDVDGVADGAYFTVFNLTGNGKVELIEPGPSHLACGTAVCSTGMRKMKGVPIKPFEVEVGAPFGAEHVVAVAGSLPLSRLMPALVQARNKLAAADILTGLTRELQTQPLQAGFRGIYSAREEVSDPPGQTP